MTRNDEDIVERSTCFPSSQSPDINSGKVMRHDFLEVDSRSRVLLSASNLTRRLAATSRALRRSILAIEDDPTFTTVSDHGVGLWTGWRYAIPYRPRPEPSPTGHSLTMTADFPRTLPLLSLLARSARLLRRQHLLRRRFRQKEVRTRARGLLRVPAPPKRGIPCPHSLKWNAMKQRDAGLSVSDELGQQNRRPASRIPKT